MVMPELPFSLLDFKRITKFEPILTKVIAAAGDAIPTTTIYTIPEHKFAWIRAVMVASTKITSTAFVLSIVRNLKNLEIKGLSPTALVPETLIRETLGTTEITASWPCAKTPSSWVPSWYPLFLFPGDYIRITHDLTVAETISDWITIMRIEYRDPRYPEK